MNYLIGLEKLLVSRSRLLQQLAWCSALHDLPVIYDQHSLEFNTFAHIMSDAQQRGIPPQTPDQAH